jgi:hypothetical protein
MITQRQPRKPTMPRYHPDAQLTLAEVRALSWCVARTDDNSCISNPGRDSVITRSGKVHPDKAYNLRVKLARRAMRKVHELRRQGL